VLQETFGAKPEVCESQAVRRILPFLERPMRAREMGFTEILKYSRFQLIIIIKQSDHLLLVDKVSLLDVVDAACESPQAEIKLTYNTNNP
jgi:hypothetical protein